MVKIIDGWELSSNAYGYILQYNTGKTYTDKNGSILPIYTNIKYPKDIKHALKIIRKNMIADHINNNDIILSDLINYLEDLENRFEELFNNKIKE